MITNLHKGKRKRQVITTKEGGTYGGKREAVYYIESDARGRMDIKAHGMTLYDTWKAASKQHFKLVDTFKQEGWEVEPEEGDETCDR